MALEKSKTLPNGSSGNYWRITKAMIDRERMKVVCNIALYQSSTVAMATNKHLGLIKHFEFSLMGLDLTGDLRALAYAQIVAKANQVVSFDVLGFPVEPGPFDPDLADAESV